MLDRIIRQGRMDAAMSELKLHAESVDVLRSKADRIAEILDEMDPAFYEGDRLRWRNDRDWKAGRQDDARLRRSADMQAKMAKTTADKDVAASIEDLRKALAQFRKAVKAEK